MEMLILIVAIILVVGGVIKVIRGGVIFGGILIVLGLLIGPWIIL